MTEKQISRRELFGKLARLGAAIGISGTAISIIGYIAYTYVTSHIFYVTSNIIYFSIGEKSEGGRRGKIKVYKFKIF